VVASFLTSTTTSTTTSSSAKWRCISERGSSAELRRALISLTRKSQAFWWLPDFKDTIYTYREPKKALLALLRPVGPFWEWVSLTASFPGEICLPEDFPQKVIILSVQESLPTNFVMGEHGLLGMYQPSLSDHALAGELKGEAMCSLLFERAEKTPHPGYPPPMATHQIKPKINSNSPQEQSLKP